MSAVALVTYRAQPQLTSDDHLLVKPLLTQGIEVVALPWDVPHADWSWFDAVIVRSAWDYHLRPGPFAAWIAHLEARQINLWNPPAMLRWNMDKAYLLELDRQGVPIVPTLLLPQGEQPSLAAVLDRAGWTRAVIKPAIGASGDGTRSVTLAEAAESQASLEHLLARSAVLVQPFMPQIQDGEWSMIFFQGRYSHAVLKHPAPEGMFVQHERGGTWQAQRPPAGLVDQAAAVLGVAQALHPDCPLLYARVDGILVDGRLRLMELELIEPDLYLGGDPEAAGRFAEAIHSTVRRSRPAPGLRQMAFV
jgi:glutathione synthase/RimK-type ligase-like ATP-grasp enzyme